MYQVQKQIKELGDKVPEETKSKVEAKVTELEDALKGEDTEKIKVRSFQYFARLNGTVKPGVHNICRHCSVVSARRLDCSFSLPGCAQGKMCCSVVLQLCSHHFRSESA